MKSPRILISALFVLAAAPFLWNCIDFSVDDSRFWLLDPGTSDQKALLPFAFTAELYYGWDLRDTTYEAENAQMWREMTGRRVPEKDIHDILYHTEPEVFFNRQYPRSNQFMAFLQRGGNRQLLQYLQFAKKTEAILNGGPWDNHPYSPSDVTSAIADGTAILAEKNPNLERRAALLLIKLYKIQKDPAAARQLFERYFAANTAARDWINAAASYQYATLQTDSVQENIWLARAWDAGFYNRIWLQQAFRPAILTQSIAATQQARDRAVMSAMVAMRAPGKALSFLQNTYGYDPTLPDLTHLMAREVNKLENWLLSPRFEGYSFRIELPFDQQAQTDTATQLKADLQHLRDCRTFVQKVIQENKRPDPAFWYLVAAHLAWLDQDFAAARQWAAQGLQQPNTPAQQQIQLQLTDLLASIGNSASIPAESENKIPTLFQQIRQQRRAFANADLLAQNLARLLSNIYIQRKEIAKGVFLLGKTSEYYEGYGYMNSQILFDKLLEIGQPADFDRAIAMIQNPQTDFERWCAQEPHRYNADLVWNEKTESLQPAEGQSTQWEVEKIREFKAMYFTRRDQLEEALAALQEVPDAYLDRKGRSTDYDHVYFRSNPFSVGIGIEQSSRSQPDTSGQYNKKTFLKALIALKQSNDTAGMQERCFLIGNAYYNMTYHASDWWLMMAPEKSVGEMDTYMGEALGTVGERPGSIPLALPVAIGLGLCITAYGRRRLIWVVWGVMALPFACTDAPAPAAAKEVAYTPFDNLYYRCSLAKEWYEKAYRLQPDTDLGIASAYMAGVCEHNSRLYEYTRTRKDWNEPFKPGPNPYFEGIKGKKFQSAVSCSWFKAKLN